MPGGGAFQMVSKDSYLLIVDHRLRLDHCGLLLRQ